MTLATCLHATFARTQRVSVMVVLALFITSLLTGHAAALTNCDDSGASSSTTSGGGLSACQKDIYNSGIYYFDASDGTQSCTTTVQGDDSLVGNDTVQKIMNYFVGQGLTAPQAAGITGNIQSESGFNPRIVQGGGLSDSPVSGKGYGLAQWTSSGRQQNLKDFANKEGLPAGSLKLQLDFMWHEITNDYKSSTYVPLQAAKTAQEAAVIVMVHYEAPKDHDPNGANAQARSKHAANALIAYGSSTGDATLATTDVGTTDTTDNATNTGCPDNGGGDGEAAQAGEGFVGNCDGKGSFAPINCGECVDYVKWVMRTHYPPYQGEATGNGVAVAQHLHDTYHVPLNHTPAVHAIVSWGPPLTTGSAGHVALVSQVNTDSQGKVTSIVVEESNYVSHHIYGKRTINDMAKINGGNYAHIEGDWK